MANKESSDVRFEFGGAFFAAHAKNKKRPRRFELPRPRSGEMLGN
jgi:hypothetical protein